MNFFTAQKRIELKIILMIDESVSLIFSRAFFLSLADVVINYLSRNTIESSMIISY